MFPYNGLYRQSGEYSRLDSGFTIKKIEEKTYYFSYKG